MTVPKEISDRVSKLKEGVETLSKFNPCHSESDGKFCATGGSGSSGGSGGSADLGRNISEEKKSLKRPGVFTPQAWAKFPTDRKEAHLERAKDYLTVSAWSGKFTRFSQPSQSAKGIQSDRIAADSKKMEKAGFTLHEKGAVKGNVQITPASFTGNTPLYRASIGGKPFSPGNSVASSGGFNFDVADFKTLSSALKHYKHL